MRVQTCLNQFNVLCSQKGQSPTCNIPFLPTTMRACAAVSAHNSASRNNNQEILHASMHLLPFKASKCNIHTLFFFLGRVCIWQYELWFCVTHIADFSSTFPSAILQSTFRSFVKKYSSQELLAILFVHCKKYNLFKVKVQHSPKTKIVFCKYRIITKNKARTNLVSATGFPVVVSLLFSHIIN